ncbi:g10398 [Coccomyxa elongata]
MPAIGQAGDRRGYALPGIDVESQWPVTSRSWNNGSARDADNDSVEASHGWLAGVILFLFLAGVMPLTLTVFGLFCVLCVATCFRAYVVHQYAQRLSHSTGGSGLETVLRLMRSPQGFALLFAGHGMNMANLSLTLMDRDFNEADYDALLQLDTEVTQSRSQISDATLRTLQTHVHKCGKAADPEGNSCKPGKDTLKLHAEATTMECSVCLEVYGEGTRVTTLPCQHSFHADCIEPWLRLQGISATCPLCKRIVFPAAM